MRRDPQEHGPAVVGACPAFEQPVADERYDITAATTDLGYSPTVTLERGLADLQQV